MTSANPRIDEIALATDTSSEKVQEIITLAAKPYGVEEHSYGTPLMGWTCFHCAEHFMDEAAAKDHFGNEPFEDRAACILKKRRWLGQSHTLSGRTHLRA